MKKTINIPDFPDLDFCLVEGDRFIMGDNDDAHSVEVASFYMAKYLVTQRLWKAVMNENPSEFKGDKRPVETVSWNEAKAFIKILNKKTSIKKEFRLPSEAEWEFAARGGVHDQNYEYAGSDQLKQVGWYDQNSDNATKEVGLLLPNELGLYDMSGNVWEWCEDDWHENYNGAPTNQSAWVDTPRGSGRLIRGGSCFSYEMDCRPSNRDGDTPGIRDGVIGFRLVFPAV